MGSSQRKIKKAESQIILDCIETNMITENNYFEQRVGMKIEFNFIKKKKKIQFILYKFVDELVETGEIKKNKYILKASLIEKTKFYVFMNSLANCISIFLSDQIVNNGTPSINEEILCPICLERKSNIFLPCFHAYCENCIKVWLERSNKVCPTCRQIVKDFDKDGVFLSERKWSIISKKELDGENYKQELDDIFVSSISKLIS